MKAVALALAFALGRMTTGTHEPLETLFLYGLGLSEDERSEEMTLFRQKKTSRIKKKIKQNKTVFITQKKLVANSDTVRNYDK